MRRDSTAAAETFQALPALIIMLVCVGIVLAAVEFNAEGARNSAAGERARLQARLFLEALRDDPALAQGDILVWERAQAVANGTAALEFVPSSARYASLSLANDSREIFLLGSRGSMDPSWVDDALPVPVLLLDGAVVPGVLRAGVAP